MTSAPRRTSADMSSNKRLNTGNTKPYSLEGSVIEYAESEDGAGVLQGVDDQSHSSSSGGSTPSALQDELDMSFRSQSSRHYVDDGTPANGILKNGASGHHHGHHTTAGSTGNGSIQDHELIGVDKTEFHILSCSRILFLGVLLTAAASLTVVVFIYLRNSEQASFESQFSVFAHEIVSVGNDHMHDILQIMAGITHVMTTLIELSDQTRYPQGFLTVPHVSEVFGTAREASGSLLLAYVPLVQPDEMDLWATYSQQNQGWLSADYRDPSNATLQDPILPNIWDYAPVDQVSAYFKQSCDPASPIPEPTEQEIDSWIASNHLNREPLKPTDGPFAPIWTFAPAPSENDTSVINHNLYSKPEFKEAVQAIDTIKKPLMLRVCNFESWFYNDLQSDHVDFVIVYPVLNEFENDSQAHVVGHVIELVAWKDIFENIIPEGTEPMDVVLSNSCGETFTFEIDGRDARVVAADSDAHNTKFDDLEVSDSFAEFLFSENIASDDSSTICRYTIAVYPTQQLQDSFMTKDPILFSGIVLSIFILTSLLFCVFDGLSKRHQNKILNTAKRQNAIVSSLFPKSIQAKMMEQVDHNETTNKKLARVGKAGIRSYLAVDESIKSNPKDAEAAMHADMGALNHGKSRIDKSKPIADLFPETTIMFGDIAGFTAWSSAREPSQVFTLLETIYHEFDAIAKRRRVFKVEVVGDCYVAVCGLPDPRKDHAVVMSKFATECVREMNRLTQALEVELGPDTAELGLRVGLHSGPVVAGVLRGEKSRFQLFGDTMNTAARMESTGVANMVQISQETADLLREAKKNSWVRKREEQVEAKGKGCLTTYFLTLPGLQGGQLARRNSLNNSSHASFDNDTVSVASSLNSGNFRDDSEVVVKRNRIADWTVEVLAALLREIEVRRRASGTKNDPVQKLVKLEQTASLNCDGILIDEVKEIIELPEFNEAAASKEAALDPNDIQLDEDVYEELRHYVRTIASLYHENSFHNFPHANHVTMSVVKLLSRIVAPDVQDIETNLHDHTYGITSDPLTRFAVVFSALIHDVDHMGISNAQLVKERDPMAVLYQNKSVAEQNSIDISWDLLMEPRFANLRQAIYTTEAEFKRFRQLIINTVLATDIMDKDLKDLRNKRWADAFSVESDQHSRQAVNRKATIVIEHLIQASDVAHTMQHWHIYRKWNERLFQELYKAWEEGRMGMDPSEFWYEGELKFFDFYIIPLAKKLKDCGVFGVSSDEYLSYAMQNRKEWEVRGKELTEEMLKGVRRKKVASTLYDVKQELIDHEGANMVARMTENLMARSKDNVMNPDNEESESSTASVSEEFELKLK